MALVGPFRPEEHYRERIALREFREAQPSKYGALVKKYKRDPLVKLGKKGLVYLKPVAVQNSTPDDPSEPDTSALRKVALVVGMAAAGAGVGYGAASATGGNKRKYSIVGGVGGAAVAVGLVLYVTYYFKILPDNLFGNTKVDETPPPAGT